ncbi:MAG TPA: hypothetical protein VGE69_02630 [Pseudomonadales bacterium]
MRNKNKLMIGGLVLATVLSGGVIAQGQTGPMSFFVTSAGSGDGGNLGGIEGADAICQARAEAAGAGDRTWRAYLSTQGANAVNARDRIGSGPWFNARGAQIAANIDALHSIDNRLGFVNTLDERGRFIPGSGYFPNRHDIMTGSKQDGTAYAESDGDMTCNNWTSNAETGNKVRLGHHDFANWNSTHDSRGCSQAALIATGGDGLFYCFAAE